MSDDLASFPCPACGMVSYNLNDVENRYCGNCHRFFPATNLIPADDPACAWCGEPVSGEELARAGAFREPPMHFACGFRSAAGSVAHLERRCSCYILGSEEGDPAGMTKREAAMAAFQTALLIKAEERTE